MTRSPVAEHAPADADQSRERLMRFPGRATLTAAAVSAVPAIGLAAVFLFTDSLGGHDAGRATAAAGGHAGLPIFFRLFVVVALIGGLAHVGGALARRVGQPRVIGEITTGLLLGPSVLGRYLPEVTSALLPTDVRSHLNLLAQVGLVLFMFSVGAEFDTVILRRQGGVITMLSQATMLAPFLLGIMIVPALYPGFAGTDVSFVPFAIFMGTAISITAFPVLARIVQDTGLAQTRLGSLAMICAGVNDVMAWCALAAAMAIVQAGSPLEALWALPLTAGTALVLFVVVKPLLQRAADRLEPVQVPVAGRLAAVLALVFALAALTDKIGVHAIFGAFLAGMILPRGSAFLGDVPERVNTLNRALLLPVFFASIGLEVDVIGVIRHTPVLLGGLLVLVVAVGSKLLSAATIAKAGGMPWRESVGLGVLLNARGVTEIVVLRAGLEIGVINHEAFTVMVLMALVTTVMTVPLLRALRLVRSEEPTTERAT